MTTSLNTKLLLLLSITLTQVGFAEQTSKKVKDIRTIFKQTNSTITAIEKSPENAKASKIAVDHYIKNALNRSWEAVGNYKVIYKYFYTHDAPSGNNTLLKISKAAKSAQTFCNEEFYYNSKGALVFYFQTSNDSEKPKEKRIYFSNGKAIRLIDNKYSRDEYTDGDKEIVAEILKNEKQIKLKFTAQ